MRLIDILTDDNKKDIENMIDTYKKGKNLELEVSFFANKELSSHLLTLEQINQLNSVLSIITEKDKDNKRSNTKTLDINLSIKEPNSEDFVNYRLSIDTIEKINEKMEMLSQRKNHLIFSILVGYMKESKDKSISIMKKTKQKGKYITIEDIYARFKLDKEESISDEELKKLEKVNKIFDPNTYTIIYRYKDRKSYIIEKDKNKFRIDITSVKQTNNINFIDKAHEDYEIELEIIEINNTKTIADNIYSLCEFIIKIVQQNDVMISKSLSNEVVNEYKKVIGLSSDRNNLYIRKPISLEEYHIIDKLQNKYAVTDKADGERHHLYVYNGKCYLINNNMIVRDTDVKVDKKFNNSILDGELIFLSKYNKYIFMTFDCLMIKNNNITEEPLFMNRIRQSDELIYELNECKYKHKELDTSKVNINKTDEILKFHKNNIKDLYEDIHNVLEKGKDKILFRRKYFMDVLGIKDNEIFTYTTTMWNLFQMDSTLKNPYLLDGLIFQPLNQKYIIQVDKYKFFEYKWKPPTHNSIDFYIEFEKDKNTGKVIKIYDNSVEGIIKNKPYYICNLYVNQNIKGVEQPVLFKQNSNTILHQAYIYLDDNGLPRSQDGKIIHDNTVVEFYYLTNTDTETNLLSMPVLKWKPMKTRYEKTYYVNKYKKGYGNYITTAESVWNCITNPVTMNDFEELSNDLNYSSYLKKIRERINIEHVKQQSTAYYQNTNRDINKEMRKFHNWIKSNIIYSYMASTYNNDMRPKILDIGVGVGGDIEKYYYCNPEFVVGIDPDYDGITRIPNGAIERYKHMKKTKPRVPPMYFILGNPSNLLTYDEQIKIVGKMPDESKELFNRFFTNNSKKVIFDMISSQFALHFLLVNETSWNNLCENINNHLHDGGYFIFTTFDGDKVKEILKDKTEYTIYQNINGEKKKFFELVKKYNDDDKSPFGQTIDVLNSWISEEYNSEYLVFYDFIVKSLAEKCNMELVESDNFENFYNNNKDYIEHARLYDDNPKNRKVLNDVYSFYKDDELINKTREISFMNRYYVFRKKVKNIKENKEQYYGSTRQYYTYKAKLYS